MRTTSSSHLRTSLDTRLRLQTLALFSLSEIMGDSISIKGDEPPNNAGYNQGSFLADHLITQLKAVVNNPDLLKGASDAQMHEFRQYSTEAAEGLEKDFEMLRRINFSVSPTIFRSTQPPTRVDVNAT